MHTLRYPYLDHARVIVAYLVILGHMLLTDNMTIRPYIYSYHMPFFFLVSGMLHKDTGRIEYRKYWKTLIVPFLFYNMLFLVIFPLCYKTGVWGNIYKFNKDGGTLYMYFMFFKQFVINVFEGKLLPDIPTWFLTALLWLKVITDCICRRKWLIPIVFCSMAVLSFVVFHSKTCLRIGNALMVMPFFYGGFYYKKEIQKWCEKRWALLVGIGLVLLNIPLTLLNGRVSTDAIWFGQVFFPINVFIFYINAFASSLGILAICMRLGSSKVITFSAKALITILCVQYLFIYTFIHFCDQTNIILIMVSSVIIFIACVFIHQLLDRYMPFAVGKYKD